MTRRIAITGAAGQIGYALVYRLASGDLLGDEPVELRLLEVPAAVKALDGVAMELLDCAFPQLKGIEVTDDPAVAFDGANVAMLVGASPRRSRTVFPRNQTDLHAKPDRSQRRKD